MGHVRLFVHPLATCDGNGSATALKAQAQPAFLSSKQGSFKTRRAWTILVFNPNLGASFGPKKESFGRLRASLDVFSLIDLT